MAFTVYQLRQCSGYAAVCRYLHLNMTYPHTTIHLQCIQVDIHTWRCLQCWCSWQQNYILLCPYYTR